MEDHEHPHPTQRSQYRYLFTAKHHGAGPRDAAQWSSQVNEDEEFSVFDTADQHDLSDERHWLYGVLRDGEDGLRYLGTWDQQVAEFPRAREGTPWHGYPMWAVNDEAPPNRFGPNMRPAKEVFQKMEREGLISTRQRKRLWKGVHA